MYIDTKWYAASKTADVQNRKIINCIKWQSWEVQWMIIALSPVQSDFNVLR